MKYKTSGIAGIDIGSRTVKCVEVSHQKGALNLNKATVFPISDPSPDGILSVLKPFFDENPPARKLVRITASGPSVVTRRVTLPIMTHAELKDAMRYEAESHVPFAIDECILDFQILNQVPNQTLMNVLLVAAKRDFIQERLELFGKLGIQPDWIDLDVVSCMNAFEVLNEDLATKSYGLLHVGHSLTIFVIIMDGFPYFVREIPIGGLGVTKAIEEAKGIAEKDAENLKVKKPQENLEELKAATRKGFEPLVDELKNSIDYFQGEVQEELKNIWMSGGGALSYEAPGILSELLGKQIALWDSTKKIQVSGGVDSKFLSDHAAELNVAFGTTLHGIDRNR